MANTKRMPCAMLSVWTKAANVSANGVAMAERIMSKIDAKFPVKKRDKAPYNY